MELGVLLAQIQALLLGAASQLLDHLRQHDRLPLALDPLQNWTEILAERRDQEPGELAEPLCGPRWVVMVACRGPSRQRDRSDDLLLRRDRPRRLPAPEPAPDAPHSPAVWPATPGSQRATAALRTEEPPASRRDP